MDNMEMELFRRIATALEKMAESQAKVEAFWQSEEARRAESHKLNTEYYQLSVRNAESQVRANNAVAEKLGRL